MTERLAIDGGSPVRAALLPYARQTVDEDDIRAVTEVLRSDWLTTGPAVTAFEDAVAVRVGARYGVAFSSGTAALHAAAAVSGIQPGDEVIVPPITFAATANCVRYCGGTPVFADISGDTGLVDPGHIEACCTDKTRAIIAVDYAGQPCDLEPLRDLARRRHLVLIEDAAHALGATYHDRPVGTWANLTIFSFHPVKHIATGEGGMVVTDDPALAEALRVFRNHGIASDAHVRAARGDWAYDMASLGFNYRIPDILCALGLSQLQKLDGWLARRREIATYYDAAFSEMPEVCPLVQQPDRKSAWHLYVVRLDLAQLPAQRADVFRALRAEGIGVNVHYIPVYWHSYYAELGYARGLCPAAEQFYEQVITLPLWPGMTDGDRTDVVRAVAKVVAHYRAESVGR